MKIFTNPISQPKVVNAVDNPIVVSDLSNIITIDKDNTQISGLLTKDNLNYTENNKLKSKVIPNIISNADIYMHNVSIEGGNDKKNNFKFENAFDLSSTTIETVNKYKQYYSTGVTDKVIDKTWDKDTQTYIAALSQSAASPSLFNDFYSVPLSDKKFPLLNDMSGSIQINKLNANGGTEPLSVKISTLDKDITDCSISRLCYLSTVVYPGTDEQHGASVMLGREKYKMSDFMYCTDLGKVSNNYLITLRKFAIPVGDNIKQDIFLGKEHQIALLDDIGRLVCWFGEENKMEDILKYSFQASWREYNAEIDKQQSKEDQPKLLNSIMNLGAPANIKLFKGGFDVMNDNTFLGGQNSIIKMDSKGPYDFNLLTNYDKNKIYEPKDTVRQTHQYEGKLTFNQDINLTFNYQLRGYDDINGKAAFLDLLSNIQAVTYRRGKFWMGQNMVYGTQTNQAGWKQADKLITNTVDGGFDILGRLVSGEASLDSLMGFMSKAVSGLGKGLSDLASKAKDIVTNPESKEWTAAKDVVQGVIKNYLGRPAKYAFNSLLTGAPTGLWHLTLGNPLNPIMSIGNLILTDTTVEHYGPLGIDDFPTGLRVKVTLKHAMPRDTIAIEQMYTEGRHTITMPTAANMDISYFQNLMKLAGGASIPSPFGNTNTQQNMINMSSLS